MECEADEKVQHSEKMEEIGGELVEKAGAVRNLDC